METSFKRALLTKVSVEQLPETLRDALLDDTSFWGKYGISRETILSFGQGVAKFRTSKLLHAIKEAEAQHGSVAIFDEAGEEWKLYLPDLPESGYATLTRNEMQLTYHDAAYFLQEVSIRTSALAEARKRHAFPSEQFEKWHAILLTRPLTGEEAADTHHDLLNGPVHFLDTLCQRISTGSGMAEELIPKKRAYYEQLVGSLSSSATLEEHAVKGLSERAKELVQWDQRGGLMNCLFLSAHPACVAAIPIEDINPEVFSDVLRSLHGTGERLCQIGVLEIGLNALLHHPEFEDSLVALIEEIRDDVVDDQRSGFRVATDLYVFVDALLGTQRTLASAPPFYRRLAAFAQSGLILRAFNLTGADPAVLCDLSRANCANQFYFQSLTDLRAEPHWYPDLLQASQLKAYACRRLVSAGLALGDRLPERLARLLTSDKRGSLQSSVASGRLLYPGPLEGAVPCGLELPPGLEEKIRGQLASAILEPSSFVALTNSVDIVSLPQDIAAHAVELLQRERYHLLNLKDSRELMTVVLGLGRVAASMRSTLLSEEIRILVRYYRRDPQCPIPPHEALRMLLFAAGAFASVQDWAKYVGDSIRELAFGELSKEEAESLHYYLAILCGSVPELWLTSGSADAALASLKSSGPRYGSTASIV